MLGLRCEEIQDEKILLFARTRILRVCASARAGFRHRSLGQSCGGWRAEDSGVVGRDGRAIRVVSKCQPGGLASHEARDADPDAVCGDPSNSPLANPGTSAAP